LLEANAETILKRIGRDANRPLVQELGADGLVALQQKRDPRYHELADLVIATDHLLPAQIATQIMTWLAQH
jgi:shikimate kinase